jgi:Fic family protein
MYIYQRSGWPNFEWSIDSLLPLLSVVRHKQGRLLGQMENLGFSLRSEAILQTLTLDVLKSNEIEGDILDKEQVRSSIARRLGIETAGLVSSDRQVDGVVEVLLDATQNYERQIASERLFGWHAAMFPGGHSGLHKITVGDWRSSHAGPMQVISGPMGKETVHFEAPDASMVGKEMQNFIGWFNTIDDIDPVLKAAIAHFWFVTVHPFDDGNGRIARCIADMQLARADGTAQRFYSMSVQIRKERAKYYTILEKTQKGGLEITDWLAWFLACLDRALTTSEESLSAVLRKARFWEHIRQREVNSRQQLMLNKLLDGFEGKLTTTKWAKITKSSQDTALRDIQQLIDQDILIKEASGGRSTNYVLREI